MPRQPADDSDPCARAKRRCGAELLERTFVVDELRPIVARKILQHLGLRAEPPELAPARPEPQMRFA
ncbi:MAG: hypothetical protein AAGA20_23150 [Planctomycetota bacterium]